MNDHCPNLSDEKLAAFIGGQLSEEQRAQVQRHLEQCPACQDMADALTQSLDLLQSQWQDQQQAWNQQHGDFKAPRPSRSRRWLTAVAAMLVLALGLRLWWPQTEVTITEESLDPTTLHLELERAAVAAQLLAAADLLAQQPGGKPYAIKRYQYVMQQFPHQREHDLAQDRLQTLLERSTEL